VPHDLEQGDQLPKPRMTHGAGQHWVLQARVSAMWPWGLPLHFGAVAVRERSCEPPAHTLVQPDQPPHEPLRPSTGQHTALQLRVSLRFGHTKPPWAACVRTVRLRCCVPVSHVLVQVVHAENALTVQCTGQLELPHERSSEPAPQALPPYLGCVSERVRRWEPPPQDLEQAP
jgi:hypothetical protein